MPIYSYGGRTPRVHPTAFVAPTAVLVGDVTIEEGASVWYGSVLRGDTDRIVLGARSNVQDNATVHTDPGVPTLIGEDVTIGHMALVHSSAIESNVLIGSGAILVGRNRVGTGTIVGGGTVVPEGMTLPPHSLVVGVPGRVVREARPEDERWTSGAARHYQELARSHRESLREAE